MLRTIGAIYPHLLQAMRSMGRAVPARWLQCLAPDIGGLPPAQLIARFPDYRTDASIFRLQTHWLQDAALLANVNSLHCFVDDYIEVDIDVLRNWMNGPRGVIFACPALWYVSGCGTPFCCGRFI